MDMNEQLKQRKENLQRQHAVDHPQQHEEQRSSNVLAFETRQNEAIERMIRNIEQRKTNLRNLKTQIQNIQQQYDTEAKELQKEEQLLQELQRLNPNERSENRQETMDVDMKNENTENQNNQSQELEKNLLKHDADFAMQLQRQFEQENENVNENVENDNRATNNSQSMHSVFFQSTDNNPDDMTTMTSDRNFRGNPQFELIRQLLNRDNDDDSMQFLSSNSFPFNSSFGTAMGNNLDNPFVDFSRMGFLASNSPWVNLENLDHDQLLQFFPNVPRGANEENIQALPEDTYHVNSTKTKDQKESESKDNNTNKKQTDNIDEGCSICLNQFQEGDAIRRLPCLHIFHRDEIDTWLRRNHVCPVCRLPVDEESHH